jgi:cytochrome P450
LFYQLSKDPSNYIFLLEEYTCRTISRLAWGSTEHAQELKIDTVGLLSAISPAGAVPNVVTWLANLPTWLSPWKRAERLRHDNEYKFFRKALNTVRASCARGEAEPSYMKMFLEEKEEFGGQDEEGSYLVGILAIAGALTIASPLQSYILAMCHFPEWQVRLREEIERVCDGRCPEWGNMENLPTLRAVVKEVLRWRPPVPTDKFMILAEWHCEMH